MPNARPARLACAALLVLAAGCGDAPPRGERRIVAVTLPPLGWIAERLVGDPARVAVLLPPGANPHSFEPGIAQIRVLSDAALLVELGHPALPFEAAAAGALTGSGSAIAVVSAASEEARNRADPHVWLSPRIARAMARQIAVALGRAFPAETDGIALRARALDAEIAALDAEIGARLAPFRGRAFLAVHPDWSAFAEDYGLRQITLERGHREPDAAALAARIDEARREAVKVLFVQPQVSREAADLVAGEIGARVVSIDPLARDWPGTLRAMTDALVESFAR